MNALVETDSEQAVVTPAQNHANSPHRIRILLVDDDRDARELNGGILTRSGYTVDTARDGAEAWKALHEASYDLLITDNCMPRVTGLDLIKKLRSEEMLLPIILASGTVPTEELERHAWMRLDATLLKPFAFAELLDTVKKVLSAAASARERVEPPATTALPAVRASSGAVCG